LKPRLLVMGSFSRTAEDNRIGGLGFACQSLVNSKLADSYEFIAIDSTISSIRHRAWLMRLPAASVRMLRCLWHLSFGGVERALCFASHGSSFAEKGVLVLAGSLLGRKMFLFPRSGHLVAQFERSRLFAAFARRVLGSAESVLCQSESWRGYFESLAGPGKCRADVVENWLADEAFIAPEAAVASSIADGCFVVAYLNRIEREKGIHDFIDAVCLAHRANPRIVGVIHGDGAELEAVQARIAALPEACVRYDGWLDGEAKSAALRGVDALVFASHAEGFPNSLLEALAQKVPVVSVRVGAVPDVLVHGESALLADIGDVAAMAQHLLALAADRRLAERLAQAAYARVREHNRLATAVDRLKDILA